MDGGQDRSRAQQRSRSPGLSAQRWIPTSKMTATAIAGGAFGSAAILPLLITNGSHGWKRNGCFRAAQPTSGRSLPPCSASSYDIADIGAIIAVRRLRWESW
jgi:hypothetical protein